MKTNPISAGSPLIAPDVQPAESTPTGEHTLTLPTGGKLTIPPVAEGQPAPHRHLNFVLSDATEKHKFLQADTDSGVTFTYRVRSPQCAGSRPDLEVTLEGKWKDRPYGDVIPFSCAIKELYSPGMPVTVTRFQNARVAHSPQVAGAGARQAQLIGQVRETQSRTAPSALRQQLRSSRTTIPYGRPSSSLPQQWLQHAMQQSIAVPDPMQIERDQQAWQSRVMTTGRGHVFRLDPALLEEVDESKRACLHAALWALFEDGGETGLDVDDESMVGECFFDMAAPGDEGARNYRCNFDFEAGEEADGERPCRITGLSIFDEQNTLVLRQGGRPEAADVMDVEFDQGFEELELSPGDADEMHVSDDDEAGIRAMEEEFAQGFDELELSHDDGDGDAADELEPDAELAEDYRRLLAELPFLEDLRDARTQVELSPTATSSRTDTQSLGQSRADLMERARALGSRDTTLKLPTSKEITQAIKATFADGTADVKPLRLVASLGLEHWLSATEIAALRVKDFDAKCQRLRVTTDSGTTVTLDLPKSVCAYLARASAREQDESLILLEGQGVTADQADAAISQVLRQEGMKGLAWRDPAIASGAARVGNPRDALKSACLVELRQGSFKGTQLDVKNRGLRLKTANETEVSDDPDAVAFKLAKYPSVDLKANEKILYHTWKGVLSKFYPNNNAGYLFPRGESRDASNKPVLVHQIPQMQYAHLSRVAQARGQVVERTDADVFADVEHALQADGYAERTRRDVIKAFRRLQRHLKEMEPSVALTDLVPDNVGRLTSSYLDTLPESGTGEYKARTTRQLEYCTSIACGQRRLPKKPGPKHERPSKLPAEIHVNDHKIYSAFEEYVGGYSDFSQRYRMKRDVAKFGGFLKTKYPDARVSLATLNTTNVQAEIDAYLTTTMPLPATAPGTRTAEEKKQRNDRTQAAGSLKAFAFFLWLIEFYNSIGQPGQHEDGPPVSERITDRATSGAYESQLPQEDRSVLDGYKIYANGSTATAKTGWGVARFGVHLRNSHRDAPLSLATLTVDNVQAEIDDYLNTLQQAPGGGAEETADEKKKRLADRSRLKTALGHFVEYLELVKVFNETGRPGAR